MKRKLNEFEKFFHKNFMQIKQHIYKIISVFFFSILSPQFFCTAALENSKQQSWIISQALDNSLHTINTGDLIASLSSIGILAKITSYEEYLKAYHILEGRYFTIYLAPTFHYEDQVWILSNPNLLIPFEELSFEHLQELENFRYLIGEFYQQHMRYQGYMAFMDQKKDYGLGRNTICLEMIPVSLKGPKYDETDTSEKFKRYSYFLFNEYGEEQINPQKAKEKIKKFISFIANTIKNKRTIKNKTISINTLPWKQKISPLKNLKDLCLQNLEKELIKLHLLHKDFFNYSALKKRKIPYVTQNTGEFMGTANELIEIRNCAFCSPKVINSQHVYSYGDFSCIYNYRPLTPNYHFMIVPRLHIEDWQHLSLSDVLQLDYLAQIVVKAIKQESKSDDVILYFQNGLAGGMTVPHTHMHILRRPTKVSFIAFTLTELTGHYVKGLTAEEMSIAIEKLKKRLQQLLSFDETAAN